MARTGPAPKPTAVRRVEGTVGRGASRNAKKEPKPKVTVPKPPAELAPDAVKVWKRLGKHLASQGLMTDLDEAAFAALCDAYAAFLRLTKQARELGGDIVKVHGQLVPNPARGRADREFEKFRKLLGEFGMTPAARTKVESAAEAADQSAGIEGFLKTK